MAKKKTLIHKIRRKENNKAHESNEQASGGELNCNNKTKNQFVLSYVTCIRNKALSKDT